MFHLILQFAELVVMMYCDTSLWDYYVPGVKKEVLEKTGIELPLPDSPLRYALNMILAPVSEMWTQYWTLEWTLWGALVHVVVLLFLGSVFKTRPKTFSGSWAPPSAVSSPSSTGLVSSA
jgi:hypothetical protein